MKLRPLDDKIVIKQSDAEEKTTGGIILPETAKEKPQIGKVIAAGPGKILDNGKRNKMSVKKNDDGEKYVILRESNILGIVER